MYTMILLLYLQQGLDVTLDQANLRGEFATQAACETAARKLRGPLPIPHNVQAAWQDVMCIKLAGNVHVNPMKPVEHREAYKCQMICEPLSAWRILV